ncbi:MAG: response regulator [Gammaproteobacteria bacterium]|nr:response regulator [Gammaproteobacteria bacterium]
MAKILSVDDSQVIREMITTILTEQGHEVKTAKDGVEAFRMTAKEEFDLIFCDINMPNMNGISFVSRVRRLDKYANVPIIMLTTESQKEKKDQAKTMGATGWLLKPFTRERILNAISKFVA